MSNRYAKMKFKNAIPGSGGIISTIAKRVGCTWDCARTRIDKDPDLLRAYTDECETVLDMAEGVLLKNIQNADSQDAKWYLSKKGKKRGYGETLDLNVDGKMSWDKFIGQTDDKPESDSK